MTHPADVLTAEEREYLEWIRPIHQDDPDALSPAQLDVVFEMLDRIAPKP